MFDTFTMAEFFS